MTSFTALLALLSLLILAQAVPHAKRQPVTLPLRRLSPNATAHHKREDNLNLINYSNSIFTIGVQAGTPAQELQLVLDTGSSNTYIYGLGCEGQSEAAVIFNQVNSETYVVEQQNGVPVTEEYGDGTAVEGFLGTDKVGFLGGRTADFQFILAQRVAEYNMLPHQASSGLMGFGLPQPNRPVPLWRTMADSWDVPMFSLYLHRVLQPPTDMAFPDTGGQVTFGGIDEACISAAEPDTNWLDVTDPTRWQIPLGGIEVGEVQIPPAPGAAALIDTGSTLVYGPAAQVEQFYAQGFPNYHIVAEEAKYRLIGDPNQIVPVSFFFNDHQYEVLWNDVWYRGVDPDGNEAWYGFMEVNQFGNDWVIGASFLENVYTSFRVSEAGPQVGFTKLNPVPAGQFACGGQV